MEMEKGEESCILCSDFITNPVCLKCLEAEMKTWLKETKPELISSLKKLTAEIYMNTVNFENYKWSKCILCKRHMNICSYCYTEHIFTLIKQNPELIEEFMTYFNFDLLHQGILHASLTYDHEFCVDSGEDLRHGAYQNLRALFVDQSTDKKHDLLIWRGESLSKLGSIKLLSVHAGVDAVWNNLHSVLRKPVGPPHLF